MRWVFANYRPPYATVRPEWSKGWAYTPQAAWTNRRMIERTLPHAFRVARPRDQKWDAAVGTLDLLDPHAVPRAPSCAHCSARGAGELHPVPGSMPRVVQRTWIFP